MQEKYLDTVLAHKLLAGARLHQATHALIGQCRKNIWTQCWHISFWRVPGSIRQHTLSLVNAGKYSDTVLAHKLLAGARLHQATHALIVALGDIRTQCWHISFLKLLVGTSLHQATHALMRQCMGNIRTLSWHIINQSMR
jgi:hypothetical protein